MTTPTPAAYYGPRTIGEAVCRIEALVAERIDLRAAVDRITTRMDAAGYASEAKLVRKYFHASLKRHAKPLTR